MNQNIRKISLLTTLVFSSITYSQYAKALVDYSEGSGSSTSTSGASTNTSKTQISAPRSEGKSSLVWKSDISLELNYEMLEVETNKIGLVNMSSHIQTPFNVYFDLNYWSANDQAGSQSGNPKLMLGFNWFRFGSAADMASVNIYGGMRMKSSSNLGSSRNDKIFGLETTKKFGSFGLGLGYDITMTGDPSKATDMAIGDIHRIEVSAGWMATNDIQFEFAVENFKIKSSTSTSRTSYLTNDLSFSTISPKINLQIFPSVNFELGARYRMQKIKSNQDIRMAKLMDQHGAYSNSVFTGLNFSL